MGVRVVKGLVVGTLLAPRKELAHEVLCEGVKFEEIGVFAKVWHHVQLLDLDVAAKVLASIIGDSLETVCWVVLV